MPKRYRLELSEEERKALERWVKNPPQPYLRERARAILRVANYEPLYQIAVSLRLRIHRNAISEWVQRYEKERLEGLRIKTGRGRKAAFSPTQPGASTGGNRSAVSPAPPEEGSGADALATEGSERGN